MNSLIQLIQVAMVVAAAGAAIFAGQFSHMKNDQFNDEAKFMLVLSALLIIGSDLFNLIPSVQLSNFGISSLFNGGATGSIIVYGVVDLIFYTGVAYFFSYIMLTSERIQDVHEWSEQFVKNWKTGQNQPGIAQKLQEPEDHDETTKLQRLHTLRQKGIITEEEYQSKKNHILKSPDWNN